MTASENASGLPIGQLGSTIKAHMGAAEKYIGKCEEHYRTAGSHLIEAKRRILDNKEFAGDFKGFLMNCCNGLAERRAYELIEVANGTKSVASIREADAERHRNLYAERKAAEAAAESPQSDGTQSNQPLSEQKSEKSPPKMGRPASPKTPEAMRWARIVKANKSKPFTVDQLDILLTLISTFKSAPEKKKPILEPREQMAPDMAHRFSPANQLSIDHLRSTLRDSAAAMEIAGISKDAIKDLFTHLANSPPIAA